MTLLYAPDGRSVDVPAHSGDFTRRARAASTALGCGLDDLSEIRPRPDHARVWVRRASERCPTFVVWWHDHEPLLFRIADAFRA